MTYKDFWIVYYPVELSQKNSSVKNNSPTEISFIFPFFLTCFFCVHFWIQLAILLCIPIALNSKKINSQISGSNQWTWNCIFGRIFCPNKNELFGKFNLWNLINLCELLFIFPFDFYLQLNGFYISIHLFAFPNLIHNNGLMPLGNIQ